jgi:hypothetical protein
MRDVLKFTSVLGRNSHDDPLPDAHPRDRRLPARDHFALAEPEAEGLFLAVVEALAVSKVPSVVHLDLLPLLRLAAAVTIAEVLVHEPSVAFSRLEVVEKALVEGAGVLCPRQRLRKAFGLRTQEVQCARRQQVDRQGGVRRHQSCGGRREEAGGDGAPAERGRRIAPRAERSSARQQGEKKTAGCHLQTRSEFGMSTSYLVAEPLR